MEASLSGKLGIPVGHKEPRENAREQRLKRLKAIKRPVGSTVWLRGRGWGVGPGLAGYHRDPQTGKVVCDDLQLEYEFRKRADLSELVWKAVKEQEYRVLDVIQGGQAAGRNARDIGSDLETFINHRDGGERVAGRWRNMFPNTEKGREEAWKREYLAEHGLQFGTDAAKALLQQPDAKQWVEQRMADKTKRGTPRLPDAVKAYSNRLGTVSKGVFSGMRTARTPGS